MLKKIESLRKRPKHVRNQYAFYGAVLVTGIIIVFWVVSIPAKFQQVEVVQDDSDSDGGFARAFQDLKSNFATVVETTKTEVIDTISVATSTEEAGADTRYTIDIEAMFATTTPVTTSSAPILGTESNVSVENRHILIATSSSETIDRIENSEI